MEMNLRTARKRRGWDQQTLAERSGIDQSTISRIESGETLNPSNHTVATLEAILGLSRGTLVFGQVIQRAS